MSFTDPDYIPPIEAAFDVGKPIRSEQGNMFCSNPIAISYSKAGAPVNKYSWHPADMLTIGDGEDGLVWDFAVDGAVSAIEVALADGYGYRLRCVGMEHSATTVQNIVIEGKGATSATYATSSGARVLVIEDMAADIPFDFEVDLDTPTRTLSTHFGRGIRWIESGGIGGVETASVAGVVYFSTAQALTHLRVTTPLQATTFTAGKLYVERRVDAASK
jgi:hypothetical protein